MLFLTATSAATQPDYIALSMVLALALVVMVMALRKRSAFRRNPEAAAVSAEPAAQPEKPTAPGSAGTLKLHDVPPKTAAMIMAIVAHNLGKPLNELRFLSIKEVK